MKILKIQNSSLEFLLVFFFTVAKVQYPLFWKMTLDYKKWPSVGIFGSSRKRAFCGGHLLKKPAFCEEARLHLPKRALLRDVSTTSRLPWANFVHFWPNMAFFDSGWNSRRCLKMASFAFPGHFCTFHTWAFWAWFRKWISKNCTSSYFSRNRVFPKDRRK